MSEPEVTVPLSLLQNTQKALKEYQVLLCVLQEIIDDSEMDEKTILTICNRAKLIRTKS